MTKSYHSKIIVSNSSSAAYEALTTGFGEWWTTSFDPIRNIGDKVTFRFGPTYWVMQVTQLIPGQLIELECIQAHHIHEGLPSSIQNEWKGTSLNWEIHEQGPNTKITFTHNGLDPSMNCFEVCEQGWNFFFNQSLKQYLDTGKGSPFIA